eukprot:105340_1
MFIIKKNRTAVYSYLFKEGVLVAKKDFFALSHEEIKDVPNLEVLALMKSLKSRDYVRETFNWQYYYYYLLPEGIEYLREYLRLPEDIVPETLKKPAPRPARPGPAPGDNRQGEGRPYEKNVDGGFNPEFSRPRGEGQGGYRKSYGFDQQGGAPAE